MNEKETACKLINNPYSKDKNYSSCYEMKNQEEICKEYKNENNVKFSSCEEYKTWSDIRDNSIIDKIQLDKLSFKEIHDLSLSSINSVQYYDFNTFKQNIYVK